MPGPEATIERTICNEARDDGWKVRKVTFLDVRGCPDRFFGKGGRGVIIEFKRGGKEPTRQQWKRIYELRDDFGWEAYYVDNLADARRLLGLPDRA
jgi:hypothetical protein